VNYYQDLHGFYPLKNSIAEIGRFSDLNLYGKLVFYQSGFIFMDHKLNAFVLSYEDIEHICFYVVSKNSFFYVKGRRILDGSQDKVTKVFTCKYDL